MGWMMGYGFGQYGWIWGIMMMLFWILIIGLAFYLVVKLVNRNNGPTNSGNGIEILKERYARGEIDEEEYLKRKRVLQKK